MAAKLPSKGLQQMIPEITGVEIRIHSKGHGEPLRAFASMVICGSFKVNDLRIIEGPQGLFVAMPSRRTKDGIFRDTAHPLNKETRAYMEQTVLNAYEAQLAAGPGGMVPVASGLT